MKIERDKALVTFTPENEQERVQLEELWRLIIDCNGYPSKLEPVGAYVPAENPQKGAMFYIEGLKEADTASYSPIFVQTDNTAYCASCNKTIPLKAGDEIPICCGKRMELLD
ncbi:MAG: hypothetical protein LBR44_07870 [Clostridiales Family XIII bacterium]|jgi:hypothetical protein|nr:hypothetical protein [Clostridiales Family XIII bacterium]